MKAEQGERITVWRCPHCGRIAGDRNELPWNCHAPPGPERIAIVLAQRLEGMVEALKDIRDNLGVPGENTPSPITHAYWAAVAALSDHGIEPPNG